MQVIQAAVLGLVQGLSEFLPISSSGHLLLARMLMGISDAETAAGSYIMFDVLLHAGTLLAVLAVFRKDWWDILKNPFRSKTLLLLLIASFPALVAVLLWNDEVERFFTGWFLGASFLVTAVLLLLGEAFGRFRRVRDAKPGVKHAVVMGLMQAIALLPGVSRSGSALTGGLWTGLKRKEAAKFAFMMSAPAILGSLLYEGKNALEMGYLAEISLAPTLAGVAVAALSGFLAIRGMLRLMQRASLYGFALYAAALGVVVLVLQLAGVPGVPAFAVPAA